MGNLIINILGVFLLIMLVYYIWMKMHPGAFDKKLTERIQAARKALAKPDSELLGRRMLAVTRYTSQTPGGQYLYALSESRGTSAGCFCGARRTVYGRRR